MIGLIRGQLLEKQPPEILIEAGGIGYEVQLPMTSFYQLPEIGQEATVYIHFVVREDAQLLFGFADKSERALFRELIKVNGVGPKLALTILSGMSASQFIQCVSHDDFTGLVKLPGVGKKTAERLVVEMRDRLKKLEEQGEGKHHLPPMQVESPQDTLVKPTDVKEDALSAMVALGYKPAQAAKTINSVYHQGISSEELIREALRSMV
ncbi:Holliday junction branch migration protein RuvA [Aliiglaciecola sp. 3_MG-2023]|uniref:Holliday junction branch migration protein RuvA n=1 Tax=Aliiglaciecola sp. 3_MG-2023 TaxID=3062644 RepID=UPI0026E46CC6|nr:Holliday junction branch migration protein RuvA [Aliiglaciecola sp. 3_MG-2023]MDO6691652.1 Holliday junction branch migration protein RuvA [Aliiglaciecola sp. 3_MG-2023]